MKLCVYRHGKRDLYVVKEYWSSYRGGFYFKKHSPYKVPFDRIIVNMREAGILEQMISKYIEVNAQSKMQSSENSQLKTLNVGHYEGPFYLIMFLLGVDVVVFVVEYFLILPTPSTLQI